MEALPTVPSILRPLISFLDEPVDRVDVDQLTELIASDNSIAAQCLRMANSPLYGRRRAVDSIRGAVIALGLARLREILISCVLVRLLPSQKWKINPTVFWEHSFGCAMMARQFALRTGYPHTDKAYLAGLLHDLGIIANSVVFPEEFQEVLQHAAEKEVPLHEEEGRQLGIDHAESGALLAGQWRFPEEICEVIRLHHDVQQARVNPPLTAIVCLSDQLCRMRGLGYGYYESRLVDFFKDPAWAVVTKEHPQAHGLDMARFTFEMDDYIREIRSMVSAVFR